MIKLASDGYSGANDSHLFEQLREWEGIDLSRPTVRHILVKAVWAVPAAAESSLLTFSPQTAFRSPYHIRK